MNCIFPGLASTMHAHICNLADLLPTKVLGPLFLAERSAAAKFLVSKRKTLCKRFSYLHRVSLFFHSLGMKQHFSILLLAFCH